MTVTFLSNPLRAEDEYATLQARLCGAPEPPPCAEPGGDEIWFSGLRERQAVAVARCHRCPALEDCRTYALAADEPLGVWGGLTAVQRRGRAVAGA